LWFPKKHNDRPRKRLGFGKPIEQISELLRASVCRTSRRCADPKRMEPARGAPTVRAGSPARPGHNRGVHLVSCVNNSLYML